MSSLVVGSPPKNLKTEKAALKKGDVREYKHPEMVAFETEVLYERIEELEEEITEYQEQLKRIQHAILSEGNVREKVQYILTVQNFKNKVKVVD